MVERNKLNHCWTPRKLLHREDGGERGIPEDRERGHEGVTARGMTGHNIQSFVRGVPESFFLHDEMTSGWGIYSSVIESFYEDMWQRKKKGGGVTQKGLHWK